MSFHKNFAIMVLSVIFIAGCSPTKNTRGNLVETSDLSKIKVGATTKREMVRMIGSPTVESTFDSSTWYYVGEKTETTGMFEPVVTDRRILVLTFDEDDKLASLVEIDESSGQKVEFVNRETPTAGKDFTILQQLIGNIGRFRGNATSEEN